MSQLLRLTRRLVDAINLVSFGPKGTDIVNHRVEQLTAEIHRRDKQRKHLLMCATQMVEDEEKGESREGSDNRESERRNETGDQTGRRV